MVILEIDQVSKYFKGLAAVNKLSMEVSEGEILGLIGPNGAGKTTLFNVITGLMRPSRGDIRFEEESIRKLPPHEIAGKGIARTFQANVIFNRATVLDNITAGFHLQQRKGGWQAFLNTRAYVKEEFENRERAIEISEVLGLSQFNSELAHNLPHGYKRRLGIAISLAARPKLLMLDEPVTGMTSQETEEMRGYIKRIQQRGVTIMLVEHNIRMVRRVCDRIVVLHHGSKIAEGPPHEMETNEAVIEAYLGTKGARRVTQS